MPKRPKGKLQVIRNMWDRSQPPIAYWTGKRWIAAQRLAEPREYARKHAYTGIAIEYGTIPDSVVETPVAVA